MAPGISSARKPTALEAAIAQIRDSIEQRERLEIELRHAQKLESVGRLAAGVAHEINTPVQFIGDNASDAARGARAGLS